MGYTRIDNTLAENGVAVDLLNDGTLFVKIRAARSKAVESERQKQQAPYRNIIMSGRPLPVGVAREIGAKIVVNAIVVGAAGTLPDGAEVGKVANGKPVEIAPLDPEHLARLLNEFPDFEEDISGAAAVNATFAAVAGAKALVDGDGEPAPTAGEAVQEASKN